MDIVFDAGNTSFGDLQVSCAEGTARQALSELYEVKLVLNVAGDGGFSNTVIDDLLKNPVRVAFGEGGNHELHGVVRELEMLPMLSADQSAYRLVIVPKLWYLTLTRRNRVFQDLSHLDIVKAVLKEHGLKDGGYVEDRCGRDYPVREYTVQHDESDFAFMSRLLEYHGIHYHFISNPDGEQMVLGDDNSAFDSVPDFETLFYANHAGANDGQKSVTELRRVRQPRPERLQVRDYSWRVPTTRIVYPHGVDEDTGRGLIDVYGEHIKEDSDGADVARIRAEQLMVTHDRFFGETSARFLISGSRFSLTGHHNPDLDQEYVITSVTEGLGGGGADGYAKRFEAIPASVPYRPQRRAAWPRLDGLVNAKVDGEARSTMTPIDGDGRYKVVIPADEMGTGGGKASRWVRRAQPSAGSGYGMHLPLHIGTECVIAHVNGDPDRPVIVGAVPNAETQSPVVGDNATHSRIRTGSGIVIEMDDDC